MNYLEADVIGQKVFIWRTREPFGLFAKIGYGDGGAPQFTKDEWERLSREVSALLALAEEWPDD